VTGREARATFDPPAPGEAPRLAFVDLARSLAPLLPDIHATLDRLAADGAFTLGSELEAFERDFAAFCGVEHCVGVSDGTEALRLALLAMDIGAGDEVVTAANTFIGTVEAIAMTGARPLLVDIDPATGALDPRLLAAAVGPLTRAVIPVHLFGRPAPVPEIAAACDGRPIAVLEDAAQAHGATLAGKRIGSLGKAAAFSFYPTKNLGALGDGGAVVTDDAALAEAVRALRHHQGSSGDRRAPTRVACTARLDTLQAGILRLKLPHLERWNEQRRCAAARYRAALDGLAVELPPHDPRDGRHVYHLFVVAVERRDELAAALDRDGVATGIHYPRPVHREPGWEWLGYREGDFPAAESAAARVLSLPLFPGITDAEVNRVAGALRRHLERADAA